MSFNDTRTAVGAVAQALVTQLMQRTGVGSVDVGRPQMAAATNGPKFNLFLYQVGIDGFLKNHSLDEGQPPPLWLVLSYLLTAFDSSGESDSYLAHELLGHGMLALHQMNFLHPTAAALADNPEPLKVTFDSADAELLSKLMQGTDEPYRVSAAFQVRPVLVTSVDEASYAPVVRSVGPPADEGVTILPSLGPRLTGIEPEKFEAGDTVTLSGIDLSSEVQWVCFDDVCYPVTAAPAGRLQTVVPADTELSPGSFAVTAVRELPTGRRLGSNAVLGNLVPSVVNAVPGPLTDDGFGALSGDLVISGTRLGGPDDSIFVAFYRDGLVRYMAEATGVSTQDSLTVTVPPDQALLAGDYLVIVRANGVQASVTPEVDWS